MKYKLVVESPNNKYVKERSKNKEHLERIAQSLSVKHENTKYYVVEESVIV